MTYAMERDTEGREMLSGSQTLEMVQGNNQVTLTTLYNGVQREGNKDLNNQRGYPLPRKPKDTEFDVGNLVWV